MKDNKSLDDLYYLIVTNPVHNFIEIMKYNIKFTQLQLLLPCFLRFPSS